MWKPQEGPQWEFHQRSEDEILFGGAKGGGKSDSLLMEATRQFGNPNYKGLLLRRNMPRLTELLDRAWQVYPALGGNYSGDVHTWTFSSGAKIKFGHCENDKHKYNYQGHQYQFIGWDQLEEFTESMYHFINACNRTSDSNLICYIRASANPGGIGHAWVKKRFISKKEPRKTYRQYFNFIDGKTLERTSTFIPSTVYDNKILLDANPGYLATLASLPEKERKALLDGNWDVYSGQFFSEFDRVLHVYNPTNQIPAEWTRFICGDYGFTAPSAVYWVAVDYDGDLWVYRELYKVGMTFSQLAREVLRMTPSTEKISYTVFDPAIFSKTPVTGEMGSEIMLKNGLPVLPGMNARIPGWGRLRESFMGPDFKPHIHISTACPELIEQIPAAIHSEITEEDIAKECEDHALDAIRYGVMSRPQKPRNEIDTMPWKHPENFKSYDDRVWAFVKKNHYKSAQEYRRRTRGAYV